MSQVTASSAAMLLSTFQVFPLSPQIPHGDSCLYSRIHTTIKQYICIDRNWCWTVYSSKAKLCPQLDTELEQDKILPTNPAIMSALQSILGKPLSLWPLFNYNYNKPVVTTGIEWGSSGCQDIYKHHVTLTQLKVYKAPKNHYLYKLAGWQFHHMYDQPEKYISFYPSNSISVQGNCTTKMKRLTHENVYNSKCE